MSSWFGFSSASSSTKKKSPSKSASISKSTSKDDDVEQEIHPAFRRRADEGVVFTASKCPPGPGLENSCELPFGLVWTPMAIYNEKDDDDE